LDPPWAVAKESLNVLGEAGETEMHVNVGAEGPQERGALLGIEVRSVFGDPGELFVGTVPVEMFVAHRLSLARRF